MKYSGDNDLELFLNFLNKNSIEMKPCNENEIELLENLTDGKELPKGYLSFMRQAGNGIGIFNGSSYTPTL